MQNNRHQRLQLQASQSPTNPLATYPEPGSQENNENQPPPIPDGFNTQQVCIHDCFQGLDTRGLESEGGVEKKKVVEEPEVEEDVLNELETMTESGLTNGSLASYWKDLDGPTLKQYYDNSGSQEPDGQELKLSRYAEIKVSEDEAEPDENEIKVVEGPGSSSTLDRASMPEKLMEQNHVAAYETYHEPHDLYQTKHYEEENPTYEFDQMLKNGLDFSIEKLQNQGYEIEHQSMPVPKNFLISNPDQLTNITVSDEGLSSIAKLNLSSNDTTYTPTALSLEKQLTKLPSQLPGLIPCISEDERENYYEIQEHQEYDIQEEESKEEESSENKADSQNPNTAKISAKEIDLLSCNIDPAQFLNTSDSIHLGHSRNIGGMQMSNKSSSNEYQSLGSYKSHSSQDQPNQKKSCQRKGLDYDDSEIPMCTPPPMRLEETKSSFIDGDKQLNKTDVREKKNDVNIEGQGDSSNGSYKSQVRDGATPTLSSFIDRKGSNDSYDKDSRYSRPSYAPDRSNYNPRNYICTDSDGVNSGKDSSQKKSDSPDIKSHEEPVEEQPHPLNLEKSPDRQMYDQPMSQQELGQMEQIEQDDHSYQQKSQNYLSGITEMSDEDDSQFTDSNAKRSKFITLDPLSGRKSKQSQGTLTGKSSARPIHRGSEEQNKGFSSSISQVSSRSQQVMHDETQRSPPAGDDNILMYLDDSMHDSKILGANNKITFSPVLTNDLMSKSGHHSQMDHSNNSIHIYENMSNHDMQNLSGISNGRSTVEYQRLLQISSAKDKESRQTHNGDRSQQSLYEKDRTSDMPSREEGMSSRSLRSLRSGKQISQGNDNENDLAGKPGKQAHTPIGRQKLVQTYQFSDEEDETSFKKSQQVQMDPDTGTREYSIHQSASQANSKASRRVDEDPSLRESGESEMKMMSKNPTFSSLLSPESPNLMSTIQKQSQSTLLSRNPDQDSQPSLPEMDTFDKPPMDQDSQVKMNSFADQQPDGKVYHIQRESFGNVFSTLETFQFNSNSKHAHSDTAEFDLTHTHEKKDISSPTFESMQRDICFEGTNTLGPFPYAGSNHSKKNDSIGDRTLVDPATLGTTGPGVAQSYYKQCKLLQTENQQLKEQILEAQRSSDETVGRVSAFEYSQAKPSVSDEELLQMKKRLVQAEIKLQEKDAQIETLSNDMRLYNLESILKNIQEEIKLLYQRSQDEKTELKNKISAKDKMIIKLQDELSGMKKQVISLSGAKKKQQLQIEDTSPEIFKLGEMNDTRRTKFVSLQSRSLEEHPKSCCVSQAQYKCGDLSVPILSLTNTLDLTSDRILNHMNQNSLIKHHRSQKSKSGISGGDLKNSFMQFQKKDKNELQRSLEQFHPNLSFAKGIEQQRDSIKVKPIQPPMHHDFSTNESVSQETHRSRMETSQVSYKSPKTNDKHGEKRIGESNRLFSEESVNISTLGRRSLPKVEEEVKEQQVKSISYKRKRRGHNQHGVYTNPKRETQVQKSLTTLPTPTHTVNEGSICSEEKTFQIVPKMETQSHFQSFRAVSRSGRRSSARSLSKSSKRYLSKTGSRRISPAPQQDIQFVSAVQPGKKGRKRSKVKTKLNTCRQGNRASLTLTGSLTTKAAQSKRIFPTEESINEFTTGASFDMGDDKANKTFEVSKPGWLDYTRKHQVKSTKSKTNIAQSKRQTPLPTVGLTYQNSKATSSSKYLHCPSITNAENTTPNRMGDIKRIKKTKTKKSKPKDGKIIETKCKRSSKSSLIHSNSFRPTQFKALRSRQSHNADTLKQVHTSSSSLRVNINSSTRTSQISLRKETPLQRYESNDLESLKERQKNLHIKLHNLSQSPDQMQKESAMKYKQKKQLEREMDIVNKSIKTIQFRMKSDISYRTSKY